MSTGNEQAPERKFFRANADFTATVILPGHELILSGKAVDVSSGGMRVVTATDLPSGQTIVLRFTLPGQERELIVRGRIVLSFYDATSKQFAHGVAFTQYAAHDQEAIGKYIEESRAPLEG